MMKFLLLLLFFLPMQAFADEILVEEHAFGNVTSSYRPSAEFDFERSVDCIPPNKIKHNNAETVKGFTFRIILPDNNYCWLTGVFLSEGNYTAMQNNVGVFTVLDRTPVTSKPQYTYCELAYWIWNGQTDDYRKRLIGLEKYVFPDYCYQEIPSAVVPEFGTVAVGVLSAALVLALVRTRWKA